MRESRTKLPSRRVSSPQESCTSLLRKHSSGALLLQATAESNNSRTLSVVFRQPHIRQASPEPMREGWPFRDSPVSTVLRLQVWATPGYSALGTQPRALRVLGEHTPRWATSLAPKLFFHLKKKSHFIISILSQYRKAQYPYLMKINYTIMLNYQI